MARMFYMISIDLGVSGATTGVGKTLQTLSQKVTKLLWVLVNVTYNRWPWISLWFSLVSRFLWKKLDKSTSAQLIKDTTTQPT